MLHHRADRTADKRDIEDAPMLASRETVAVVDDDPDLLKAIGRVLSAHGFHCDCFASAEAFLEAGRTREPACLVLDIHLGGMSGIELRRRLKASHSRLPVIFITSIDDEAAYHEALDVGCVAYLRKPFRARALMDAIGKASTWGKFI
jgi:FixJ family two-component response regulator